MNKIVNFITKTVWNMSLLCFIVTGTIAFISFAQGTATIHGMPDKKLKELTKYTRPLKDVHGNRYCSSSSVKYGKKSYTLTNMHCCMAIYGEFEPGLIRVGDVLEKILFISSKSDVCILTSTVKSKLKIAKNDFAMYDSALLLGYPRGDELTPRFGYVLALNEQTTVNYGNYFLTRPSNMISFLSFPGNSGSPVFNMKGEVVNLLYAGPHPLFAYGITVTNKQIKEAFIDMKRYGQ